MSACWLGKWRRESMVGRVGLEPTRSPGPSDVATDVLIACDGLGSGHARSAAMASGPRASLSSGRPRRQYDEVHITRERLDQSLFQALHVDDELDPARVLSGAKSSAKSTSEAP